MAASPPFLEDGILDTTPFPDGKGKEEGASPPQKEANPASLRSAAPSKGRGSRGYSLLPMEGGAPKGRRLDGGSRMKKIEGRSSQVRRLREYPSAADAVPFPQRGRQRGGGFAAPKGSQPRLAALGSPFQGKGLAWTLPPSYGRRCPEGAEVGWGKRYEKDRGEIVSSASFTRAALSPYRQSEYMHVWKNNTPGKAFPAWGRWRAK